MSSNIKERNLRTCSNGHTFYKTSACPVCPLCEALKKPEAGFLSVLPAPARRALESKGITTIKKLSRYSENEILALHGIGPSSLPKLRTALAEQGYAFKAG